MKRPEIIKKTRKRRVAIGSGVDYATINKMLSQYFQMKKLMKTFVQARKKGAKGLPIPGMGKGASGFMEKLSKDFKF